jgi:hypothetical protein
MGIDALECVKEFYVIEALYTAVNKKTQYGIRSQERLLDDISELRNEYNSKFASAIYDYTVMVVYGEMRHGREKACHYNPKVTQESCRIDSYREALSYLPKSVLQAAVVAFDAYWNDAYYGGVKWLRIASTVLKLYGNVPNNTFCDACISLSHNASPYLDKANTNIFYIKDKGLYKDYLDFKRDQKDTNWFISRSTYQLGDRLIKLLVRAENLKFLDLRFDICIFDHERQNEWFILNYKPQEWGRHFLSSELEESECRSEEVEEEDEEDKYRLQVYRF